MRLRERSDGRRHRIANCDGAQGNDSLLPRVNPEIISHAEMGDGEASLTQRDEPHLHTSHYYVANNKRLNNSITKLNNDYYGNEKRVLRPISLLNVRSTRRKNSHVPLADHGTRTRLTHRR